MLAFGSNPKPNQVPAVLPFLALWRMTNPSHGLCTIAIVVLLPVAITVLHRSEIIFIQDSADDRRTRKMKPFQSRFYDTPTRCTCSHYKQSGVRHTRQQRSIREAQNWRSINDNQIEVF